MTCPDGAINSRRAETLDPLQNSWPSGAALRPLAALLCVLCALGSAPAMASSVTAPFGCEVTSTQWSSTLTLWPLHRDIPAGAKTLVTMHNQDGSTSLEDRGVQTIWRRSERRPYTPMAPKLIGRCEAEATWDDPNAASGVERALQGTRIERRGPILRKVIRKPVPKVNPGQPR